MDNQGNKSNQESRVKLRPAQVIQYDTIVAEIWANQAGNGFRYTVVISHAYVGHHGIGLTRVIPYEKLGAARWAAYKAEKWIRRDQKKNDFFRSLKKRLMSI